MLEALFYIAIVYVAWFVVSLRKQPMARFVRRNVRNQGDTQ